MALGRWVTRLLGARFRTGQEIVRTRGPACHVIILDGTMSSLDPGRETNAGHAFRLLMEMGSRANLTVYYEAGIQWQDWGSTYDVLTGRGINRQIERAYGVLASRYVPGDRIFLIGYSRGAFAVRSLAGVIDMVGLVRADAAVARNIRQAYRHYRTGARTPYATRFRELYCHPTIEIEAIGVWDTVKSLGIRLPVFWRWAETQHAFHNHALGDHVRHGFHALALDETREAFAPVMWESPDTWQGVMEQVWFPGAHGDVGGQLGGFRPARPLSHIPFVWLMGRLEICGLPLPPGWQSRFPQDAHAPSAGTWRGSGAMFLSRRHRIVGRDKSERLHETVRRPLPRWLRKQGLH